ncbi:MAG: hypothetical protein ACOCP1_01755 [Campylobacterales bacterium]
MVVFLKALFSLIIYIGWLNLGGGFYESVFVGFFVFILLLSQPMLGNSRAKDKVDEKIKESRERMIEIQRSSIREKRRKLEDEHEREAKQAAKELKNKNKS